LGAKSLLPFGPSDLCMVPSGGGKCNPSTARYAGYLLDG
jgi:hypothetical protein